MWWPMWYRLALEILGHEYEASVKFILIIDFGVNFSIQGLYQMEDKFTAATSSADFENSAPMPSLWPVL